MLQNIRDSFTGVVAVVAIAAIGVALVITFIDTDTITGVTNYAARVNDQEISLTDFRQVSQQQVFQQEQASSNPLSEEDRTQVEKNVLEGMIRNRVVSQYVRDMGYRVSDQAVLESIRSLPGFQVNGQFSSDAYLATLASQNIRPAAFEEDRRTAIQIDQLQNGLLESAFFTPSEYRRFVLLEGERRRVAYGVLSPQQVAGQVSVSEDELKAFYEARPEMFESPESVALDYVEVKAGDFESVGEPTEEQLRSLYEAGLQRFQTAAQRRARHILIAVDGETNDAAALGQAEEIRARIGKGEDFAALARQYSDDPGSAAAGGELGWAGKGTYVEPFEAVLFAQVPGEVSDPVKTDFGYHIIQLEEVRQESQRSFADVRDELAAEFRERGGQDRFFEITEKMDDAALENPGSLDAVAAAAGMPVRHIEVFTRAGGEPLGAVRGVVDAAFSAAVLEDGENSPLVEVSDGHAIILRVTEHRPVRLRPMDEVREELEPAARAEKAAGIVADRGVKIVEEARAGGDMTALLAGVGVKLQSPPEPMARNSDQVPPEVVAAIFRTARPGKGTGIIDGVSVPGGGYVVFRVDEVIPGNPDDIPRDQRDGRKNLLARQVGVTEVASLAMDLRQEANVVVAPDLFEKQDTF